MSIQALQKCTYLAKFVRANGKITCCFFSTTNAYHRPRCFANNNSVDNNDNDVKAFEEIEQTFFGNNQHNPVDTKKLLKEFTKQQKTGENEKTKKTQRKQNKETKSNNANSTAQISKREDTYKEELGIHYTKLKWNDPIVGKLFLAARSKKSENKQIICEGWRLISEATNCGLNLQALLFSKDEYLKPILNIIQKDVNAKMYYKVPQQTLRTWSSLTTCPGLIAIFERPASLYHKNVENNCDSNHQNDYDESKRLAYPITVVCDNIREPNNLGSIIRTCAAIPCSQVIVMKGCCDPWETKALRGGCGGQFRINIKDHITWEHLSDLLPEHVSIFIAENNLQKVNGYPLKVYNDIKVSSDHNCVIIGGETEGVSENAYRFMKHRANDSSCINIPLADGIDSLNTSSALTLILFEMRKNLQLLLSAEELNNENIIGN